MSTTGSKAGTRVTLAAASYTDITTQFEALGNSVYIVHDLPDLEVGLVTAGETPSALPEVSEGAIKVSKGHESTLDIWAESTLGGDIWLVVADKEIVVDVTGTTSA